MSTWNVQVVGFVPTGWMYEMKRKAFPVKEKGPCFIHLVPYSEHSSYSELREYVQFLRPHKVATFPFADGDVAFRQNIQILL